MNARMFQPAGMDVGNIGFLIHRMKGANGYCYVTENWKVNGTDVREIALTDSAILGGIKQILTTLAHELIHACNAVAGINDFSGKYHNKKFATACDRIGLKYELASRVGVRTPVQDHPKFDEILASLTHIERDVLDNLSVLLDAVVPTKPKTKNLLVHVCPVCGAKARATATTRLICGNADCMEGFMECETNALPYMEVQEGQ